MSDVARSLRSPLLWGAVTALAVLPKLPGMVASLAAWAPAVDEIVSDLKYVPPPEADFDLDSWQGMPVRRFDRSVFDGYYWTRLTAQHWELPLGAVALYFVMIPLLRAHVAKVGKYDTRSFALWWNMALSLFSMVGFSACAPVMWENAGLNGLHFSTCAPAAAYGAGWNGLWVALFIYSKFAELIDTALLLLAGRPVILLHWWHHATVLLYCWHSYSTRIATGLWFATMNYGVHSVMYAYFGATQHSKKARLAVKPFAIFITLLQLAQMVGGIFVTIRAMVVQAGGAECHVNKTNSILGLTMYASYFLLFLKLFVDNYILAPAAKTKTASAEKAAPPVVDGAAYDARSKTKKNA